MARLFSRMQLGATTARLRIGAVAGAGALFAGGRAAQAQEQPHALDVDGVGGAVYSALINRKVNACPMAIRVAWHASGTFDEAAHTGGSNGGTMRFEPEHSDPANAGLFIIHDLLLQVKRALPALSFADLWTLAGCKAVEFMGGPRIPFNFGRTDAPEATAKVPRNGLLPDASQGAEHLREVFGRMGFSDRDIVALSGAHTVGRCHKVRSGYDGPWTRKPLKFDNEYFVNLMTLEWKPRAWDGPLQYTDVATESLTMLPTDMALRTDPAFKVIADEYAKDQAAFFRDFSSAFSRLVAKGCPVSAQPAVANSKCPRAAASAEMRELAMHGSLEHMERLMDSSKQKKTPVDIHSFDLDSGRTAMHKAAFWGHNHVINFLTSSCCARVGDVDFAGDTPMHDAARFGHVDIVRSLLRVGADCSAPNHEGDTPLMLAELHGKHDVIAVLRGHAQAELAAAAASRRQSFLLAGQPVPLAPMKS